MDFHEDSCSFESLKPVTMRNASTSSSVFYSANHSPFFSPRSPANQSYEPMGSDKRLASNKSNFQSTATENSRSSWSARFSMPDVSEIGAPSILDELQKSDNANSSTGSSSTFYSYHQESGNGYFDCLEKFNKPRRSNERPLTMGSAALTFSSRLRRCDIFIGFHGSNSSLTRFANWLCADLEGQGLRCYATDRARCRNSHKRKITEKAMDLSSFGVVILTKKSFKNPFTIEELRFFSTKRNLIPIFFDMGPGDCMERDIVEKRGPVWEKHGGELWLGYGGLEYEWREAISALFQVNEWKLEAQNGNWRDCVYKAVSLITERLGRRSVVDRLTKLHEKVDSEEFPFPRNEGFVGRKKELSELEFMLFGDVIGESSAKEYIDLKAFPKRKTLFPSGKTSRNSSRNCSRNRKGKDLVVWKESEKDIEMQSTTDISQTPPSRSFKLKGVERRRQRSRSMKVYGKGVACVSGEAGIGKTELLLEFAYRHQQHYKMVLWIDGESRYMRQSYLNLWPLLDVNVGFENCQERGKIMSFKEQEEAAVSKIRKELMRNVPILIIIDNLESEKDFWDHKPIMDLLPRFGGQAHIIVSTCLPRVLNLEPLKLSYLSEVESLALMQAGVREYSTAEIDALKAIEEKLGRLTLGLAIVGSILSELPISPSSLLLAISRMPLEHIVTLKGKDSHPLKNNKFLLQLLEVCFSIFDHADGPRSLATRMVQVGGWFSPARIPVSLLASAANKIPAKHRGARLWQKMYRSLSCGKSSSKKSEAEAASMLIRFNLARSSCKEGHLHFNNLIKLYARKRLVSGAPQAMVQAIISRGQAYHHLEHFWAACFLVLGFGALVTVELKVTDLLVFVKHVVIPLAIRTFIAFSRCEAALELLRLCTEVLEQADQAFVTPVEKMVCCAPIQSTAQMNPFLWQELALSRANVLETRAKLMLRGGEFDVGDDLIRSAISIRTSIYGENHPDTQSAKETLRKFTRLQAQHISP